MRKQLPQENSARVLGLALAAWAAVVAAAAVRGVFATLSTAEIYGLNDRMGSIEPGKIANLTVTDGDLFQTNTKIRFVVIDGVKYEPVPEAAPARGEQAATAEVR